MDPLWIPVLGAGLGPLLLIAIVALATHYRLGEARLRIEAEIQRMEMAYQHARQNAYSRGGAPSPLAR